jgi:dTDP-4-dehydrorhamnose 3,5-epimerase
MFTKTPTSLTDCFIIEPQMFWDSRGFFMEIYSTVEFEKIGVINQFIQDNHSKSKKWVLRGLHFQTRKPQAKLVRVTSWSVYDVVVDLRSDSPTYGKWEGFHLSAENKKQLFIPRWFAHGFLTLEDDTEFLYKCDDVYDPGYEGGISWDDISLWIDWQKYRDEYDLGILEISPKDQKNETFESYKNNPVF